MPKNAQFSISKYKCFQLLHFAKILSHHLNFPAIEVKPEIHSCCKCKSWVRKGDVTQLRMVFEHSSTLVNAKSETACWSPPCKTAASTTGTARREWSRVREGLCHQQIQQYFLDKFCKEDTHEAGQPMAMLYNFIVQSPWKRLVQSPE